MTWTPPIGSIIYKPVEGECLTCGRSMGTRVMARDACSVLAHEVHTLETAWVKHVQRRKDRRRRRKDTRKRESRWVSRQTTAPEGMRTLAATAEAWGVSLGLVARWCRQGRFPGAVQVVTSRTRPKWYIPDSAVHPQRNP